METTDEVEIQYKCTVCTSELDSSNVIETDYGKPVCENCTRICERCDGVFSIDDSFNLINDDVNWCEHCTDSFAHWCDEHEGHFTGYTYSAEDRGGIFCEYCYENSCSWCEYCEASYYDGCPTDHEGAGKYVHDYSYRPDPIFHSKEGESTRLYFGVEIETEVRGGDYDALREAAEYAQILENENVAYLKSDGSLECGFEIVSHPMSHSYFIDSANPLWQVVRTLKSDYNMMSWGTRTCGLHVHISRAGFNGGTHQHRFLQLVYNNKDLYELLAGRSSSHWAKFDDVINPRDGKKTFMHKVNRDTGSDRYSAVNTNNRQTLEMRIFKGSLNPRFIKSAVDLAHASVEYTRIMNVREVVDGGLSCTKFIQYIRDNKATYESLHDRIIMHNDLIQRIERKEHVSAGSKFSE
jgi:hypothetical protein